MAEMSSGKPPFYKRKHDVSLALEICNGLRPEFGKGTPEIYKKLAHRCMNANPNQKPTANELFDILFFWSDCRIVIIKKWINFVIKEKKLKLYLKKLIKRYQIFQPHTKKILMLCILVEYFHLIICRNLLIHQLL